MNEKLVKMIKEVEPFIAILIFLALIFIVVEFKNYNELQKEISANCGWSEEDYKCYCQKDKIDELIRNEIELNLSPLRGGVWD